MSKTRPTGRKRSTSTALAKRTPRKAHSGLRPLQTRKRATAPADEPKALLTPSAPAPASLDDSIALGDFGLVELKITTEEELVLRRPIPLEELRVKPTGQVYLPHIGYTRWLNDAFGRTGWALRPASKPLVNEHTVVIPYLLMVHGKAIAFALGEQEYFASNKDQTYGDALESTVASGLRRCCKHLGLALELWDRSFNDQFLREHCVRVACEPKEPGGKKKYLWRLKTDEPFWNEIRGRRGAEPPVAEYEREVQTRRTPPKNVTPIASHPHSNEPISADQATRLWMIARKRGRTDDEVKTYLTSLGYANSRAIPRSRYETICQAIEHPGPLGLREPGSDDV